MAVLLFSWVVRCLSVRGGNSATFVLIALWLSPLAIAQPREPNWERDESNATVREELRQMRQLVHQLETRITQLEAQLQAATPRNITTSGAAATTQVPAPPVVNPIIAPPQSSAERQTLDFFRRVTINGTLDGYYSYNFNRPVGGINLLRAYDVTSNSFNLNQAALVLEQAPNVEAGQRFGMRLDLQFGQATETVQGNAANEPRPHVFRNVWQAYGTYVVPVGKGLTVDFGKFAGALGYETNYTKDNFNYSRSYFFNYLPFYHFGFRATYPVSDKLTATYWLVNGANQSEDFNGFKSQAALLTYKPTQRVTVQTNYYVGQEQRDRNPALNPTFAPLPTQPGLSTDVIRPTPRGRFHVLDALATFNVTDKLTLAVEGDYVINRVQSNAAPARVTGGAGYVRYQFRPKFALTGRFAYLSDRGGLFSGTTQALKDTTLTADYKVADGFLLRSEWRRDSSNQPFFLTHRPGGLKKEQNTATLGLIWWFGRKEGSW
ncbi:MAG TPA: porin [Blastocatellia bacterium]|nr:porin [Blastocatellia bacterium]